MTGASVSRFQIDESITSDPVSPSPFVQGSGNVFPKYANAISKTAWELWYFDGFSRQDQAATVIGMNRNARGQKLGGFEVQVLVIWPDKSTWHRDLYFPESVITTDATGEISGVWSDPAKSSRISFTVQGGLSGAALTFSVPDVVNGTINLAALPGDTGLDTEADLGPSVHFTRPIGRASVTADMWFYSSDSTEPRNFSLSAAHGGMDHSWSPLTWDQLMIQSDYLRAEAGPYAMHLIRIISDAKSGRKPYTVARLYREGKLVCAAQQVVKSDDQNVLEDSIILSKVHGSSPEAGITGVFREKTTGYSLEFIQGGVNGQRWRFQVKHGRIIWNIPTSAPGPDATGNTGFVESVVGGIEGEAYAGVGTGGQCELPGN